MSHSGQPLAEVFGHLVTDQTDTASRYRSRRLCPFNNKVPNCTKDKAKDPLSGNIRDPFAYYMSDPQSRASMDWSKEPNYPRPDYLSSSRKRLVPQLVYKGGILHSWNKKIAVALNKSFFATLPTLKRAPKDKADIAWLIYDLKLHVEEGRRPGRYCLTKVDEIFTEFEPALLSITTPSPGDMKDFIKLLQEKLDEQLETPPTNQTIERPF